MCSAPQPSIGQQEQGGCALPWSRPMTMYYFDSLMGTCLPFEYYGGCGGTSSQMSLNMFSTYGECMQSCQANSQGCTSGCSVNPVINPIPEQDQQPFVCYDGSYLMPELVCNGVSECMYGEDEMNCQAKPEQTSLYIRDWDPNTLQNELMYGRPILVEFYSPKCKACQEFKPEYEKAAKVANDYGSGVTFGRLSVESYPEMKKTFNITTLPRLLLWTNMRMQPSRFFKNYGLTSDNLLFWLQDQLQKSSRMAYYGSCRTISEFQCDYGACIPTSLVCDRITHCMDASDEVYCQSYDIPEDLPSAQIDDVKPQPEVKPKTCLRTDFTCRPSMKCIPYLKRCDGVQDCPDGSDEQSCQGT